jgi:signal transduction histidine kinase
VFLGLHRAVRFQAPSLLHETRVSKSKGIRHRLLTILLLGAIVSALSVSALIHLLTTTTRQRVERARDGVTEEVSRLARDRRRLVEEPANAVVGMRAGILATDTDADALLESWRKPILSTIALGRASPGVATRSLPLGDSTLVVAAKQADGNRMAWAGYLVRPVPSLRNWQWIVTLLTLATAGLVATTLYSVVTVQRGAAALRRALTALATDLSAPIPRPSVRELSSVADGIAKLAEALVRASREEERLQQKLALQERLAALGRVAAGVAHEVRNPLASIKLRLDLAAARTSLPPDVESAISHATTEIQRLDRLVADLLIVAGRAAGPRRLASLGELAKNRVDALAPWALERGVELTCRGDASVEADTDSIARSVDNLLRNAVEASAPGGAVGVTVSARGGVATISVVDRGPGVAPAHALELFEPFFTTKPDGTGLGLALSRAIVRGHGGDLQYYRDGTVTRLDITLPEASVSKDASAPALPATPADARRGAVA